MTRLAAVKRRLLLATDHLGPVRMRIREGPAAGTVMYAPLRRGRAYSRNRHEPHIAAAIATTACPGMVALDIGAYLGYFSLMMALAVGPTGHVFSFEPADEALTAARRTMAANRLANVTLLPHAVGNVSGQSHLRMSPNESMNMLVDTGDPHADLRTVPVCRIDDWMGRHQAPTHVDLMKLDVEGHELAVLHGAENTLLRWNPTLIVELHRRGDVPYQPHEPVDWLRARGYHLDILQPPVPNPASLDDALRSLANPELDPNKTYILHLIARR